MHTFQRICSECGDAFTSGRQTSKTCGHTCKTRRQRRRKKQGADFTDFAEDYAKAGEVLEKAVSKSLDRLPEAAHQALTNVLTPVVREALTDDVLRGIGAMVRLLPMTFNAIEESLTAVKPVFDAEGGIAYGDDGEPIYMPDSAERMKAATLALKYTLGQSGLAPQAEAPEQAPITVVFPTMPAPPSHIDGEATAADLPELPEGCRECDVCSAIKPAAEFVGSSNRCEDCHAANRARAEAAIAARTAPAPDPA